MKENLINLLLSEQDRFFSGEEIARSLGISRQALWKKIETLRKKGWNVEGLSGKGYRLVSAPSHLEYENLRSMLSQPDFWEEIHVLESVDSTNTFLLGRSEKGVYSAIAVADAQKSGRGRMGRNWFSPSGKNIYLSILLPLKVHPTKSPTITIVAGLTVVAVIKENLGIQCRVKWPNDVYLSGKKLCGILTETVAEFDATRSVVIGIGINVNSERSEFPDEISDNVISLKEHTGKDTIRAEIVALIADKLLEYMHIFERYGLEVFVDEWERSSYLKGKKVKIGTDDGEVEGKVKGIDTERGYLIVEDEGGKHYEVISGEVEEIKDY